MVTHGLPLLVITLRQYVDPSGRSPFAKWFESLNAPAAAKVTTALVRIEQGNFRIQRASAPAFMSAGLISARDIASISGRTATRLLSCLAAGRRNAKTRTSWLPRS